MEIADIDSLIAKGGRYSPRWGWHDDHRHLDGTPQYLPALMQVRSEFSALLDAVNSLPQRESALQLGYGNCSASHDVWSAIFDEALTIDLYVVAGASSGGLDSHSPEALALAKERGPFDFLFIDAGHLYEDVERDHVDYAPLVRHGGIIAFHDALFRASYPELGVWRYLRDNVPQARIMGDEVGTAWYIK